MNQADIAAKHTNERENKEEISFKRIKQDKSYQSHTLLIDLSMLASCPGKGLVTAEEPRSSIEVFYKRKNL